MIDEASKEALDQKKTTRRYQINLTHSVIQMLSRVKTSPIKKLSPEHYIYLRYLQSSGSAVWVEDSGLGWCANHAPEEYHARQKFLERELEKVGG